VVAQAQPNDVERPPGTGDVPRVMVVDDDQQTREGLSTFLTDRGYEPILFANPDEAVKRYHVERPAAIVLDITFPGPMDGLEALAAFKKIDRDVQVIVLSGQVSTTTVVQAMKLGAADFVNKPFHESDLEGPLSSALRQHQLSREVAVLREQLESQGHHTFLVGSGERMAEVRDLMHRVADTDVTVLIRGESGTGKELVARELAASSTRRDKPFVKVNCAALPTELLESELFGFERGAFTGAIQHKPGKFEFANHGTLFLDEIGDMNPSLQAKLLQVLQDGEFSRLGGKRDVQVDVRVIAATNRNLERAVADGEFREDLYFRLNVVCISLPPLRERRDEIPMLVEYLLKKHSVQYHKRYTPLSAEAMRLFMQYDWPGNVREMENLIKRSVILGGDESIRKELAQNIAAGPQRIQAPVAARAASHDHRLSSSPGQATTGAAKPAPYAETLSEQTVAAIEAGQCSLKDVSRNAAREAERELIMKMLQQTRWNRKEAAEILGISYKALLYKIKENGLDKAS
jgi:two-component system, NtrC family, response regulator AtoC